jgi:hypothetical protein
MGSGGCVCVCVCSRAKPRIIQRIYRIRDIQDSDS